MHPIVWRILRSWKLNNFALTRGVVRRIRWKLAREQYLRENPKPKLHMACGPYCLEGWLNADIDTQQNIDIFLDARETLPFEDDLFWFVFAEHFIEHLTFAEGQKFCREVYRTLRPGGVLRLSTPDLQFYIRYYEDPSDEAREYTEYHAKNFLKVDFLSRALVISNCFHAWGHRLIYDWNLLKRLLREAGFHQVERRRVGESPHPQLGNIEQRGRDYPFNHHSLVVEAVKPLGR